MQALADEEGLFLHGYKNTVLGRGHWNETGHRIAGEIIADEVCARILADLKDG